MRYLAAAIMAAVVLLLPAFASAQVAPRDRCLPTAADAIACAPAGSGWYFDFGDRSMDYQVNNVGWLTLSGSGTTLTLSSDQGTTITTAEAFAFTGAVTMSSTFALSGSFTPTGGVTESTQSIADTDILVAADCGDTLFVTAGIDTKTITLPATIAGCEYTFMYVGADGGALLDISPNSADAVHGSCTLAGSVVEFNGTADNDIGLTKLTANTGDTITLMGDGTEGWYVTTCTGIWANN